MSFVNVLVEAFSLNIGFFIGLFMNHPFWLFAFAAAAYFLYDKKILIGFPIVVLFVYLQVDWSAYIGWAFGLVVPVWLLLHIFSSIFTSDYKFLGKHASYGAIGLFTFILIGSIKFGLV